MEESLQGILAFIFALPVLWRRFVASIDLFPCFSVDPNYGIIFSFYGKAFRTPSCYVSTRFNDNSQNTMLNFLPSQ